MRFELPAIRIVPLAAALALGLAFALSVQPVRVQAQSASASSEASLEPLDIVTASGTHHFSVEVMRDDASRARGLMYRRYLPADRGMLFDFKTEQPVSFWMKNTYLPLDMIFVDRTGKVANIVENAEPLSERLIPSGPPVLAVLEVNAGIARKIGLKIGDRLRHPLFR